MLQKITGKVRKAIEDYNMISEGDKIAVALSGGKDSITLLYALNNLRRFYPIHFDIMAITIHPDSDTFKTDKLEKMCKELNIEYIIYHSDLSNILFDVRKEKNPCSLCANLRRGMLNTIAIEHGCNKLALGHHLDDVIETLLMNMCLNGNIHTFSPVTTFGNSQITVIRPLIYVYEKETRALSRKMNFPVVGKCCPKDGYTMRQYFKDTIFQLDQISPVGIRKKLIKAMIMIIMIIIKAIAYFGIKKEVDLFFQLLLLYLLIIKLL